MKHLRAFVKERKLRTNVLIGALLAVAMIFAVAGDQHRKAFDSVEVQFTDASHSGLAIVPASCPSNPYDADAPYGCTTYLFTACPDGTAAPNGDYRQCRCAQGYTPNCPVTPPPPPPPPPSISPPPPPPPSSGPCLGGSCGPGSCLGGTIQPDGSCKPNDTCTGDQHPVGGVCVCDGTNLPPDSNGKCTVQTCVPPFTFDPGSGKCILLDQCGLPAVCSDSTHVKNQCTGAITNCALNGPGWICENAACIKLPPPIASIIVSAHLVERNTVVQVSWESENTTDCSVSGNNNDGPWQPEISGKHPSSPITAQTVYTLVCHGEDGSTLTKTTTINIIPVFNEP